MSELWPTGVPNNFEVSGFGHDADSGIIRSYMDSGPAKVRRRFTSVTKNYKGSIVMTHAQFLLWETWFEDVICFGSLTFTMPDPVHGGNMTARIVASKGSKPYSISQNGATDVSVSFAVEKMP
jgi:hypothetical protein